MELSALFGGARVAQMREFMKRFAAQFGITDMRHSTHLPNTRRVLAAAELARDRGRLDPFRHAAMDAYWREGRDLEDETVLREIARQAGVDPDAAVAAGDDPGYLARLDRQRQEAARAGVTGIPTFVFGQERVVGCQPYPVLAAAAQRAGARRKGGES